MWGNVKVKTPGALPLQAADLRRKLRIDSAEEDDLLRDLIAGAAAEIEGPDGLGIAMMAQTWTLGLDGWQGGEIELPGWPVTGVAAVRYTDPEGVEQVLDAAAYRVITSQEPARLVKANGASWPTTAWGRGVVEVDYTLGRATAAEVDRGLVVALMLTAGHWYENREAVVVGQPAAELPLGAQHILARFRRGYAAA